MKKLLVLTLTMMMVVAFASISMASTMGVNVNKGTTVSVDSYFQDGEDPIEVTGNFGVSDNLLLKVGYNFNHDDSDDDFYALGARYEIIENVAAGFRYTDDGDNSAWTIDLRGKYPVSDQLAFTGKIGYTDYEDSSEYNLTAQAEYAVKENFIPTFGFDYYNSDEDGVDSVTYAVLGMDFYPTDKFSVYLDYAVNVDESDDDYVYLGLEYAF